MLISAELILHVDTKAIGGIGPVAMTPQQEAEYVLAYGQRDDCSSAEARAEYDRLKAAPKPRFDPPPKKEVSSSAGKAAAALPAAPGSLVVAGRVRFRLNMVC